VKPSLASVILPVYNQADHIASVLREYVHALERLDIRYELLPVVNGVRRDQSLEICQALESEYPVIRTQCIDGGGWGRAVRAGLAQAQGDIVCFSNSARTTGKDLLLFLLYGSIHTDAVIKANRKIRAGTLRRLGSLLYNIECRALYDLPYWDVNGTPKVFSRANAPRLLELTSNDDMIDLEFNAICRREDYQMIEIPIFSTTRHSGRSTTNFKSAFRMYLGALRLRRKLSLR
jgi:glycosyltransferase involved in cell wall biosynthesis